MSIRYQNIGRAEDYSFTEDRSLLSSIDGKIKFDFEDELGAEEIYIGMKALVKANGDEPEKMVGYRSGRLAVDPRYEQEFRQLVSELEEGKKPDEIAQVLEQ